MLVSGNDYPDALCAGPLAGAYNGPLLYVPSDGLGVNPFSETES